MTSDRSLTCLTYHDIADIPGPATLHLGATTTPDVFARQLDYVQKHYNVIALDTLLAGDLPARAAMITFDDAYASVARIAAPMLAERELPAVFFVNPGPVAQRIVPFDGIASLVCARFGPAELADVASAGSFAATTFGMFMNGYAASLGLRDLHAAKARLLARLGTTEAALHAKLGIYMTATELTGLAGMGIEVANHTTSHVHCGPLTKDELQREIVDAKTAIEAITDRPVRAFAFPWGRHADATAAALDAVRGSGHRATFLMHGRNNGRRPAADIWYRVLVTDQTGLTLTASLDVLPRLREVREFFRGGR
jgi:peptidoglycan/xylan/chitin deacetylase (PgdA/CDA1 family)